VSADVDVHQYSSLIELSEESFTTFADRKAAICKDEAITYGELDEMSAAIGAYLQGRERRAPASRS
jgi:long-chain acyl-CoA synthetase